MRETMYYFGILFKINFKYVKKRINFLKEFLNIPSADILCSRMRYSVYLHAEIELHFGSADANNLVISSLVVVKRDVSHWLLLYFMSHHC